MVWTSGPDPYVDENTGLLKNKVGATTRHQLSTIESDIVMARTLELVERPPDATSDLLELQAIHGHLFQDIYSWAGQTRVVDIRKSDDDADAFAPSGFIPVLAANAARELHEDNYLQDMGYQRFIRRIAYHYDQFNYIHPFREGNGRVQRIFWSRIARDAGWYLDWRNVTGQMNDRACRAAAVERNFNPLYEMFEDIVNQRT